MSGGNSHQRAVEKAAQKRIESQISAGVAQALSSSVTPTMLAKSGKTMWQKLFDFFEHGWVIAVLGTIGTLVGFLYGPILVVCGIAVLLAFHRVGVVRGHRAAVQIAAYSLLFIITFSLLYGASRIIKKNIPHIPTVTEITNGVVSALQQKQQPAPSGTKETVGTKDAVNVEVHRGTKDNAAVTVQHREIQLPSVTQATGVSPDDPFPNLNDEQLLEWGKELTGTISRLANSYQNHVRAAQQTMQGEALGKEVDTAQMGAAFSYKNCCAELFIKYRKALALRVGALPRPDLIKWSEQLNAPDGSFDQQLAIREGVMILTVDHDLKELTSAMQEKIQKEPSTSSTARHLTQNQQQELRQFGNQIPPGVYFYVYALSRSVESQAYGREIAEAIGKGGPVIWGADVEPIPTGLIITTMSADNVAYGTAANLSVELFRLGIPSTSRQHYAPMDGNPNTVTLVVGIKPPYN